MTSGGPRLAGWRRAGAVALLALSGCSNVPTEPVRGTPMRGQQQGRLPGVPEEKPFVEADIAPPPYPADSTLIEFALSGQTSNRFYIDGSSLTVDQDKVVRFILVIRTPGDVNNVRFSGLRCSTREWKDYAIARADHTWVLDKDPSWQWIQNTNFNNYQRTLYHDFFCINGVVSSGPVGDAKKLVKLLKNPPRRDPRVPGTELLQ
jgi:hypothetical protein